MLIAGIIGDRDINSTANLINSFLTSTGRRISIVDSKSLAELDPKRIKSYTEELNKNNIDILIFKINTYDVEKEIFNNIHFDIMVYTDKADDLKEKAVICSKRLIKRLFELLHDKSISIINVDEAELVKFFDDMNSCIITYGFNSRASITASSIGDMFCKNNIMCCLQRTIATRTGVLIEPQEYKVRVEVNEPDAYNILAAASFAIVSGVDLSTLN